MFSLPRAGAVAIEAAEHLKRKHPNADVMVKDLRSGEATAVGVQARLGVALTESSWREAAEGRGAGEGR
jgi:hypothetical protein